MFIGPVGNKERFSHIKKHSEFRYSGSCGEIKRKLHNIFNTLFFFFGNADETKIDM